ncbi:hypothetical protein IscW_ISCW014807 [Ixodes scapularis]|uniref:Uncharacterized protein n=1 Tax=Ixodes scapularis TaxID=6945 RepID=B7QLG5_IXOSC|nr:hypothetical protein IscW_ISCW014807 [Ixodes scapularis]|eukprot:XP_002416020.1 hypothetical protein IscW_ISCW014807 [Ixodes scapularis]
MTRGDTSSDIWLSTQACVSCKVCALAENQEQQRCLATLFPSFVLAVWQTLQNQTLEINMVKRIKCPLVSKNEACASPLLVEPFTFFGRGLPSPWSSYAGDPEPALEQTGYSKRCKTILNAEPRV